jgi:hypothetical protein
VPNRHHVVQRLVYLMTMLSVCLYVCVSGTRWSTDDDDLGAWGLTAAVGNERPSRDDNRGVLNGPLTRGGHTAEGEGDRQSLRLAIEDLMATYGRKYPGGEGFLARLAAIESEDSPEFAQLKREALLANPVLDFDQLLLVRTKKGQRFSRNWQTRVSCQPAGHYDDELVVMSPTYEGELKTVYRPDGGKFVGDVDLHFDADRLLFASHRDRSELTPAPGRGKGYAVFELAIDPATGEARGEPRLVSPDMGADVDSYDACYLPDDRIVFASTASYEGVPCVGGGSYVANLYRMNPDGTGVRRLTFDQDASWHPAVMENGRILYTRWEYTDSAHYFSRVLMTMNPDGTDQKAFYASNSYWPNSLFFARQIPGHPSKFLATVTGHHSNAKGGALCLFDVTKGRHEADGAVQLITGRGKKVEPLVIDNLARAYKPMFYTPYPLDDKYFLAVVDGSVYLVDVFDNMLCLKKADDARYYEPIPLRKTTRPARMPDRINYGPQGCDGADQRHLRRPGAGGRAARYGQAGPRVSLRIRAPAQGRPLRDGHGGRLGRQAGARHRAGGGGRLGELQRAGQHAVCDSTDRRRRQSPATDAKLDGRHARRTAVVRGLP